MKRFSRKKKIQVNYKTLLCTYDDDGDGRSRFYNIGCYFILSFISYSLLSTQILSAATNVFILQWWFFFFLIKFAGNINAPIFTVHIWCVKRYTFGTIWYFIWCFFFLIQIILKVPIQKQKWRNMVIPKSNPDDLKLSLIFLMGKTNLQTKLKLILTIFERFSELWYFDHCLISQLLIHKTFNFQLSYKTLIQSKQHISLCVV